MQCTCKKNATFGLNCGLIIDDLADFLSIFYNFINSKSVQLKSKLILQNVKSFNLMCDTQNFKGIYKGLDKYISFCISNIKSTTSQGNQSTETSKNVVNVVLNTLASTNSSNNNTNKTELKSMVRESLTSLYTSNNTSESTTQSYSFPNTGISVSVAKIQSNQTNTTVSMEKNNLIISGLTQKNVAVEAMALSQKSTLVPSMPNNTTSSTADYSVIGLSFLDSSFQKIQNSSSLNGSIKLQFFKSGSARIILFNKRILDTTWKVVDKCSYYNESAQEWTQNNLETTIGDTSIDCTIKNLALFTNSNDSYSQTYITPISYSEKVETTKPEESSNKMFIIIGGIFGISIAFIVVILLLKYCKKAERKPELSENDPKAFEMTYKV